ncbi:MAG: nuclear transport factor 2 family protein [Blastocatellia bacterium]|nr:nuclear transport factor 2 family protein [Blastocatellia bacterium]
MSEGQMPPLSRRAFTASISIAAAGSLPAFADEAEEIEQTERRLVAAIAAVDLATYDQLVADDYVVVQASGIEMTKADVIASYRSGARRYKGLAISEVKVHLYGETAVLSARSSGFRIDGGHEVPNNVRYIRVYARRRGNWRAIAQMATPIVT